MRILINATLAFAFVGFVAGLAPLSAHQLARLQGMKSELAAAQAEHPVRLRSSILR